MKFLHEKLIVLYSCPIIGSLRQMYRVAATTKKNQGIHVQSPFSAHSETEVERGAKLGKEVYCFVLLASFSYTG